MAQRRIIELFEHDPAGSHLYNRLLIEAAIKDRLITACGQTVHLKRGQLVFGRSQWASKTGLTQAVIRRVLKQLEDEREISQLKFGKITVISILSLMSSPTDSQEKTTTQPGGDHSKNKEQWKGMKEGNDKNFVAGAQKKDFKGLDFSPLNMTPELVDEVKTIRKAHTKGKPLTQRIINTLGTEFATCRAAGATDDQILNEWNVRGWQGFKADWFLRDFKRPGHSTSRRPTKYQQQMADQDAMFDRFLGNNQQQQGFTYEHE